MHWFDLVWSPPWCRIVSPLLQTKRNSISDFTQTQTFALLHGTIWSPNWNSVRNSWWIRVFKVFAIKVSHQCSYLNPWRILLSFGFLIRIFEEFHKHVFASSPLKFIYFSYVLAKVDDYISDISLMFLNPKFFSRLDINFSDSLDMSNLQEQVRKSILLPKIFLTFTVLINCCLQP